MSEPVGDLSKIIRESVKTLEDQVEAVVRLPLAAEYKSRLLEILREVHGALETTEPIVANLRQVRELIVDPVNRELAKAFDESNKWGIRGLKASVVSLLVTLVLGVVGIIVSLRLPASVPPIADPPRVVRSTENPLPVPGDQESPKLKHVFRGLNDEDGYFLVGHNLRDVRLTFGRLDVAHREMGDGLLQVPRLPPLLGDAKSEFEIFPRARDQGAILQGVPLLSRLELSWRHSGCRLIGQTMVEIVLGDDPDYFAKDPLGEEALVKVDVIKSGLQQEASIYVVLGLTGPGPGGQTDLDESGVSINGKWVPFSGIWPYWEEGGAIFQSGRVAFVVPSAIIKSGRNDFIFRSAIYKREDTREIKMDNYMVHEVSVYAPAQ